MKDYLKEFATALAHTTWMESEDYVTPSVAYITENGGSIGYHEYIPPVTPKVIATVNIVDDYTGIRILNFDYDPETGDIVYDENLKSVIVDNIEISVEQLCNNYGDYVFDSAGEHTISYEFDDVSDGTKHFGDVGIETIILPENITSFSPYFMWNAFALTSVTILATTPPTLGEESLRGSYPIFVPSESVQAYKTTSGWSEYASRIQAIQE